MSDVARRFDAWVRKKYAESPRLQAADEKAASVVNHMNGADAETWADKKLGNNRPERTRTHEELGDAADAANGRSKTAHDAIEFARGVNPVMVKLAEKAATLPSRAHSEVKMARNNEYPQVVPLADAPDGSQLHVNPETGQAMYATPVVPQNGSVPAASMSGPSAVGQQPHRRFFGLGGGIPVAGNGMMASKKKKPTLATAHPQSLDEQIAHLQKMKIAQDEQDEGLKHSQPAIQPQAQTQIQDAPMSAQDEYIRKRYDPGY